MNYNQELNQFQQPPKKKMPEWLEIILIIAGITLAAFLIIELIKYLSVSLVEDEKEERTPRVFISHSWTYDKEFNNLIQRFEEYGFGYYNHSIPKDKPLDVNGKRELLEGIRRKMINCSKFIILAGMYVNNSKIIKEEIKMAKELGKEIIAIRPHGINRIPKIIRDNANVVIGTHTPNIIEHLKR